MKAARCPRAAAGESVTQVCGRTANLRGSPGKGPEAAQRRAPRRAPHAQRPQRLQPQVTPPSAPCTSPPRAPPLRPARPAPLPCTPTPRPPRPNGARAPPRAPLACISLGLLPSKRRAAGSSGTSGALRQVRERTGRALRTRGGSPRPEAGAGLGLRDRSRRLRRQVGARQPGPVSPPRCGVCASVRCCSRPCELQPPCPFRNAGLPLEKMVYWKLFICWKITIT